MVFRSSLYSYFLVISMKLKSQDKNLLLAIGGCGVAVFFLYLLHRQNKLDEINLLQNQKMMAMKQEIQYVRNYIQYQHNRIQRLENNLREFKEEYNRMLIELESLKSQVQNDQSRQLIMELIQRVKQKKDERTKNLGFYN